MLHWAQNQLQEKRDASVREKMAIIYIWRLTALSSWRIIASNSSCPRRNFRRVPVIQLDKERSFSWTFWQNSADGRSMFSIPTLSRLS